MAENERTDADEAPESEETESPEPTTPAGPFLRDFNPLTDGYPRVSPRSAVVQFYRNGGYTVKRASGVQHVDKPVLARPHSICEIALGTYVTPLAMELVQLRERAADLSRERIEEVGELAVTRALGTGGRLVGEMRHVHGTEYLHRTHRIERIK